MNRGQFHYFKFNDQWWAGWRWLWVVAFVGSLVFVSRDTVSARADAFGFSIIHRIVCISVIAVAVFWRFIRDIKTPFQSLFLFVTLFSAWQLTSALWSDYVQWTVYRSFEYFITGWFVAYTVMKCDDVSMIEKWMALIMGWVIVLLVSVWCGALLFPQEAFITASSGEALLSRSLAGVFPVINPNSVSAYSGVLTIFTITKLLSRKRVGHVWYAILAASVTSMILAQGRSGLVGFCVGLLTIFVLMRMYRSAIVFGLLLMFMFMFTPFFDVLWEYFRRGQTVDQVMRFSGRMPMWEYAWDRYISYRPFTGYGAFSAGRFTVMADSGGWSSLHSSWMETAVGCGVVGVFMLALIVGTTLYTLIRAGIKTYGMPHHGMIVAIASIAVLITVRSFFSLNFSVHNDFLAWMCIGTAVFIRKHPKLLKRQSNNGAGDTNRLNPIIPRSFPRGGSLLGLVVWRRNEWAMKVFGKTVKSQDGDSYEPRHFTQ